MPPSELAAWCRELGFEATQRDTIVTAASRAEALAAALARVQRPSAIAAAVGAAPLELVALAGALGAADQAREWLQSLRHVRLEIDGDDLRQAGVRQGPAIGAGLAAALAARLDGRICGRAQELAEALNAAGAGG
jgi:tRNA nucleotidyltransferase (CCA-adding enzyme)